jgi:hypothetical protein
MLGQEFDNHIVQLADVDAVRWDAKDAFRGSFDHGMLEALTPEA